VWLALPVSAIATVVSWLHSRGLPTFEVTVSGPTAATVLTALAMAPGLMALGVGARRLWGWFKAHRLPNSWALPPGIAAAGLLTGTASLWLPVLPGNGRDALEAALASPTTEAALVALGGVMVLKPVLTGLTLGAGATGGLLAPSFALGGSAGAAAAGLAGGAGGGGGGGGRRLGDDPQRQGGGGCDALAEQERHGQDGGGAQPPDRRRRGPRGLLGAVEAEDGAEAGAAAQDEAGQVGEGRPVVPRFRGRQATQPDEETDSGDEHIDVEGPAPAEPIRQGSSDEEAGGGPDTGRRAEECEDPPASGTVGEGGVEKRQRRRAE